MDVNRYATKKTVTQGMLDLALLTANASQLKYILQNGDQLQFYTLLLWLISASILLQVSNIRKTRGQKFSNPQTELIISRNLFYDVTFFFPPIHLIQFFITKYKKFN